jgi:putative oxidoreductase
MKALNALQPLGLLLLRLALGIIFIYNGYPKLLHQGAALQVFFTQHGLPGYFVYIAGILEVFGGGLLILGLFARAAGLLLAGEMAVAIWKVHSGGGIMDVHNYQFPLVMATACFAIMTTGAGMISLDGRLFESGGGRSRAPKPAKSKN